MKNVDAALVEGADAFERFKRAVRTVACVPKFALPATADPEKEQGR